MIKRRLLVNFVILKILFKQCTPLLPTSLMDILTTSSAHLDVYFFFLLPDYNFFEGMKETEITFRSQSLTFSGFLMYACWRKEFHLLGCAWWQVTKHPIYTDTDNKADTLNQERNLVQWPNNVIKYPLSFASPFYFLGCHITHTDTNWLPVTPKATKVFIHDWRNRRVIPETSPQGQGSLFSESCSPFSLPWPGSWAYPWINGS